MVWTESLGRLIKKPVQKEPVPSPPECVSTWDEKRREPRVELEVLMTATTRDGEIFRAYSRDLSHSGSAAIIWGELKLGERVSLAYRFPQLTDEIVVPAVVRHATEHRYGMEFIAFDREHLQAEIARIFKVAGAESPSTGAN